MSYKFVLITDEYIDYLRKTEPRVMSNKAGERIYHRKYLGIIEELNGHKYFIPLSSPKPKDYKTLYLHFVYFELDFAFWGRADKYGEMVSLWGLECDYVFMFRHSVTPKYLVLILIEVLFALYQIFCEKLFLLFHQKLHIEFHLH